MLHIKIIVSSEKAYSTLNAQIDAWNDETSELDGVAIANIERKRYAVSVRTKKDLVLVLAALKNMDGVTIIEELLTISEIAKELRVDATTVRRWVNNGVLNAVWLPHFGKRTTVRIRRTDLESIIEGDTK
jgi:excisionase family DNA binding protein